MKLSEMVKGRVYLIKNYSHEKYAVFLGTETTGPRKSTLYRSSAGRSTHFALMQRLKVRDIDGEDEPDHETATEEEIDAWYERDRLRLTERLRMTDERHSPERIRPQAVLAHYADDVEMAIQRYEIEQQQEERTRKERDREHKRATKAVKLLTALLPEARVEVTLHRRVQINMAPEVAEKMARALAPAVPGVTLGIEAWEAIEEALGYHEHLLADEREAGDEGAEYRYQCYEAALEGTRANIKALGRDD